MLTEALPFSQNAQPLEPRSAPHQRHRPEQTLLYQVVEQHYPAFVEHLERSGRSIPRYVKREFEDYLKCGRLDFGFLRVRCTECHAEKLVAFSCKRRGFCPSCGARRMAESAALLVDEILPPVPMRQWVLSVPFPLRFLFARDQQAMGAALAVVYRCIAGFLIRRAGLSRAEAQCGAVTLIQRFGSALNLNVHFHMLIPDGVYLTDTDPPYFRPLPAPTGEELQELVERIAERMGRQLERRGLLVRDLESSHLALESGESDTGGDALSQLQGHSITYRIAVGPQSGRKALTLQTVPPRLDLRGLGLEESVANANGFSLHAGVATEGHQRTKLERLCRYISRPAVSVERLSLTSQGNIRYALKTPYRDGTTHVVFEPLDFMARLAALIPNPQVNLTRYHGVFAPNHRLRSVIVPGREVPGPPSEGQGGQIPRHAALGWARRLKRVFGIEVQRCDRCGGSVKIIAAIEDPQVIGEILDHLGLKVQTPASALARGPPGSSGELFEAR